MNLRAQRQWLDQHPGQVLDESIMVEPAATFDPAARARIVHLEASVAKLPQYDCPVRHYFVDGLYVREISIPAGCVLVGYIHMQPCITTLSKGTIVISDGDKAVRLTAPYTTTVAPGTKKAGYALTDVIWSDAYVNADNERDIAKLEARLTANTHDEFMLRCGKPFHVELKP